jgi:hypothetical protein
MKFPWINLKINNNELKVFILEIKKNYIATLDELFNSVKNLNKL